jgi:hypothetical protein
MWTLFLEFYFILLQSVSRKLYEEKEDTPECLKSLFGIVFVGNVGFYFAVVKRAAAKVTRRVFIYITEVVNETSNSVVVSLKL